MLDLIEILKQCDAAYDNLRRLTRLAASIIGSDLAMISLQGDNHHWGFAAHGFDLQKTPREHSFCGVVLTEESPLVVIDASRDTRFDGSDLVNEHQIRSYVGVPINVLEEPIGTLCVLDRRSKDVSSEKVQMLEDLSHLVSAEITRVIAERRSEDLEHLLATDALTGCRSRREILKILDLEAEKAKLANRTLGAILIDVDDFSEVNNQFGHSVGDRALHQIAHAIKSSIRDNDSVGRIGGEEFLLVLPNCSDVAVRAAADRIVANVADNGIPVDDGNLIYVTVSVGFVTASDDAKTLLELADKAMYRAKTSGKNRATGGFNSIQIKDEDQTTCN